MEMFAADFRLMFNNCRVYNAPDTVYFKCATRLEAYFESKARGVFRTCTRPTLNLLLLLRASVSAFTLKVSQAPISVECLFSMTLLRGGGGHHLEEQPGHAQVPGPLIEPAPVHYEQTVRYREGGGGTL